jgi:hypothetical protein
VLEIELPAASQGGWLLSFQKKKKGEVVVKASCLIDAATSSMLHAKLKCTASEIVVRMIVFQVFMRN